MSLLPRYAPIFGLAAFAATPANAALFVYAGSLTGAQESPPTGSPGTGSTIVTYDDVAHTLHVQVTFSGLIGNTTASHIHVREDPSLPNGGVATTTPTFAGFPLGVTSGTYDNILDLTMSSSYNPAFITLHGGTIGGAEAALVAALADSRTYLNVHSTVNTGGEIRAALVAVPEMSSWAMMIIGFAGLGFAIRYGRRAGSLSTSG